MERTLIDDRYELSEPLGGGGMAYVCLAHDQLLGRNVAVKLLRGQYAEDAEFVERFKREAQNAASLSHPNIVQTYDRGETGDGGYYIAMEHVPGGALSDRIDRDGSLPAHVAAEVGSQVADALGAAHEAGLIHRDIKPHNVLVTNRGDVKVADFGIARAAEETSISRTSAVLGTAAYMSPEQALGRDLDPRSDLYSLGVVLYEMLTGGVPFTGASPTAVSLMHVNEEPRPPAEVEPDVPAGINALVMKLLAKDPAQRYGSATELVENLDRVSEGLAPPNAGAGMGASAGAGVAAGSPTAEATTLEADGAEGAERAAPEPAATPQAASSQPGGFRVHRGSSRRTRFKRLLAVAALAVALIGALGWLAWPTDGPGVAGSLDGVPEIPGKVGEAIAGGSGALADAVTGPEQAEVPQVAGLEERAATERLGQAGFEANTRPRQSTAEDTGVVLEQSVAAGDKAEEGSTILLAVGSGPDNSADSSTEAAAQNTPAQSTEAPELVGLSYSEAESRLEEADLTLGGVREVSSQSAPAGTIVSQDPKPGAAVEPGAAVYLATSTGPSQSGSAQGGSAQSGTSQDTASGAGVGSGANGGANGGASGDSGGSYGTSGYGGNSGYASGSSGPNGGSGGSGSGGDPDAGAAAGAGAPGSYAAPADYREDEPEDKEEQEGPSYEQYESED